MSPSTKTYGHPPDDVSPSPSLAASRRPELPDLDLEELSPLPPAQDVVSSRPTPTERRPALKRDGASRSDLPHVDAASPALSAVPSSFRLEGSPPDSPRLGNSTDASPAPKATVDVGSAPNPDGQREPLQAAQLRRDESDHNVDVRLEFHEQQKELPSNAEPTPSARYVTVSAILSRSEMYYAPEASDHWSILRPPSDNLTGAEQSNNAYSWPSNSSKASGSIGRKRSQRKRPSNGSAIEALGALLLRKDSSGRVASLSFARDGDDSSDGSDRLGHGRKSRSTGERAGSASKHGVQAWTSALGSFGKRGLRLQLPHAASSKASPSNSGGTIAERRAKMWQNVLTRQGAIVEDTHNGFAKVRSRRGGLSFEVGTVKRKQVPSTLFDLDTYEPGDQRKETAEHGSDIRLDAEPSDTYSAAASGGLKQLPGTILLKAGHRPRPELLSTSGFGVGSAYLDQHLPEAPPSPVAMPGAWQGGSSWRSKPGDGYEEGALLLPPPLLDDHGSDASSFEGLLGVRRMREREKARKQAEKLAARNRPTHKVGPLTALTNFVKAAHAAETSAKRMRGARRFGQPPAFARSYTAPQPVSQARSGSASSLQVPEVTGSSAGEPADTPKRNTSVLLPSKDAGVSHANDADITLQLIQTRSPSLLATTGEGEARRSPIVTSASPFLSPLLRRAVMSRRSSRTGSVDATGRHLNTVFESVPLDPSQIPDDELASPDLPPISSPLLRPSSQGSSKASTFRDFPAAPRLLPVQLSMPPSPFTPLAIDHRTDGRESRAPAATSNGDYLSARVLSSAPRTPQLGPTMLSLPPSPWTPYQDSSATHAPTMIHLHLNTSSSSLRLLPGTPRLVPTHIEILPSPFPTSASSRRGSLTYDSPHALHAIGTARSPLTGATTDFTSFAALRPTHVPETTSMSTAEAVQAADVKSTEAKSSRDYTPSNGALRLTPSSMLVAAQSQHAASTEQNLASQSNDSSGTRPTTPRSSDHIASHNLTRRASMSQKRRASFHEAVHVDASGRQRSFVLWFLIGDLGLRNRSAARSSQAEDQLKAFETDYGGIAAIFVHTVGLLVFVAAHVVDLAYSTYEKVSLVLWFLRWMAYNLTGRTVLAQCIVEAYSFIQAEWATVAIEDHEERGSKRDLDHQGHQKPKGLTRWQVLRGLLELYCLHSVTRERYLSEGAGLRKLEGWRKPSNQGQSNKAPKVRGSDRVDIGTHRAASRAALDEKRRSWAQQDDKIEFGSSSTDGKESAASHSQQPSADGGDGSRTNGIDFSNAVDDKDDNYDDDDGDSSDDEMIVTNRGDDILEFAKTPRLDAMRPGHSNTGYFGRAYDFMTSPQVCASQSDAVKRNLRPLKESTKDLVRTIKWCGRLAISAYGLHVHIVDLPPTFTPSGDRFSRQTFAYLSRLNADDVLHADIQTLDADADYSPTFYVVRDYVRKVVCVAVRGTQSFSDIIVDLEMQTEEIELPQVQPTPGEEFRCHAGIWRAAKALVSPQSKLFATLRQALAENEGFGVMFCGHSLGGAIASAAALLLAEYFIPDGAEPDAGAWVTNMSSGLPARRPIRAVSFASPVTMTADLATRAARGSVPLVTTVVLGSDIIPRVGHGQVRELRRVLGALSRVRRRHAMASSEGQDDARVHILRSYWDWRSICMAEDADDVMLHRKERIEEQLWSLRREVESDLYAAIKARLDAESTAGARIPPSPWVGPQQRDEAPLHKLATRRQELDMATLRSEAAQGGPLVPPGRCIWINNEQIYHVESPLAFFSLPELRSDMFAAHFPAAYEEAILELRT